MNDESETNRISEIKIFPSKENLHRTICVDLLVLQISLNLHGHLQHFLLTSSKQGSR
jgi:hypothetical protein